MKNHRKGHTGFTGFQRGLSLLLALLLMTGVMPAAAADFAPVQQDPSRMQLEHAVRMLRQSGSQVPADSMPQSDFVEVPEEANSASNTEPQEPEQTPVPSPAPAEPTDAPSSEAQPETSPTPMPSAVPEPSPEVPEDGQEDQAESEPVPMVTRAGAADLSRFFYHVEQIDKKKLPQPVDLFNPIYKDEQGIFGPKDVTYIVITNPYQLEKIGTNEPVVGDKLVYPTHILGPLGKYTGGPVTVHYGDEAPGQAPQTLRAVPLPEDVNSEETQIPAEEWPQKDPESNAESAPTAADASESSSVPQAESGALPAESVITEDAAVEQTLRMLQADGLNSVAASDGEQIQPSSQPEEASSEVQSQPEEASSAVQSEAASQPQSLPESEMAEEVLPNTPPEEAAALEPRVPSKEISYQNTGKKYAANENYLIVADIDLAGAQWTPWDYSGKYIKGCVTENAPDGSETMRNPVISNFTVVEDANPDTPETDNVRGSSKKGMGFFGAVFSPAAGKQVEESHNQRPWWDIIGNLLGALGKLVGSLLKLLGGLVGDLVGLISGWKDVTTLKVEAVCISGLTLSNVTVVTDGLYTAKDKTGAEQFYPMPVGGFAGQVSGDVKVSDCRVEDLKTVSAAQWAGGFAGKTIGSTEYLLHGTLSGLSGVLGSLGGVLDSVLNLLLPTDDLVSGLIEKLGVENLIPVKYLPAKLEQCSVAFADGQGVQAEQPAVSNFSSTEGGRFAGGFAGRVSGTTVRDCRVQNLDFATAKTDVGGFAGRICNTQVMGLLQGLGVNLVNFPVGSLAENCAVNGSAAGLKVTATVDDPAGNENALAYAGGFAGAVMASNVMLKPPEEQAKQSSTISGVTNLASVEAKGNYVGGFAGYAGVGDLAEALNLLGSLLDIKINIKPGAGGQMDIPLGSGLTTLLNKVLGVNLNAGILSLIGLSPAQLVGCRVQGVPAGYSVTSQQASYAGGFVGFLHGGRVAEQMVEASYDRVQATDENGNKLYVGVDAVTEQVKQGGLINPRIYHQVKGAVYARLEPVLGADGTPAVDENGTPQKRVIYEDVHGNAINPSVITDSTGKTIYNIYDNVYINLGDKNKPAVTAASFRDAKWNAMMGEPDKDGNCEPISLAEDLPPKNSIGQLLFPVYQQVTTADGYVQFTYHYTAQEQVINPETGKEETQTVAKQIPLYRKEGKYYTLQDGKYTEYTDVNVEKLSVDALQVAVDDAMIQTGSGTAVTTYIDQLASVEGQDYVGGVVGQAKLCSAVDLLSNITVAQYERFELNNIQLNGIPSGYTVTAHHGEKGRAGGAVGYAMGGEVRNVQLKNLAGVRAPAYAGGFAGQLIPGSVASEENGLKLLGLINVSNLLTVVDAVHTFVNSCSVSGVPAGFAVTASNANSQAGGFVGGSVNGHYRDSSVQNLSAVQGGTYAGGFCGRADSGSVAKVMEGLGIDVAKLLGLSKLLSLLDSFPNRFTNCTVNVGSPVAYSVAATAHSPVGQNAYTPQQNQKKRVNAMKGIAVEESSMGSAGGFLGYGAAVQIDGCANENLKSVDAVRYAGGFGGFVDIGSVANLGNAGLVGGIAKITGIASLLDCAAAVIQSSHTQGASGGYVVSAFDRVESAGGYRDKGMAGGFIGNLEGGHLEGCYASHLDKIQGEEAAGGLIGRMLPGDVAKVAQGSSGILDALVSIDGGLVGALNVMVPSVKNSFAKCVPCGGVVTAYGWSHGALSTDPAEPVGAAGGFVGLNAGGQIWGEYDEPRTVYKKQTNETTGKKEWVKQTIHTRTVDNRQAITGDYTGNAQGHETDVYGTGQTCDILQILQVDGTRFAGGYSGYIKAADVASVGNIKLLGGLVDLSGLLSVGQVVVPTQKNTGVTGPLRNVSQAQMDYFNQLNSSQGNPADFTKYYGYIVGGQQTQAAGGYCGMMDTGVVEKSRAYDLIGAMAQQQAGGFVGAMLTGGVVDADLKNSLLGSLVGGVKDLTEQLLGVANVIVPVIKQSGVFGYYSGSQITALNGTAGGFAGTVRGGQIWGDADAAQLPAPDRLVKTWQPVTNHCFTRNLRSVSAQGTTADAGGFVGYMGAASLANLGGLGLLGDLVKLPDHFISALSVTVPTAYYTEVDAVDGWGFTVDAAKGRSAGGFAGYLQGAQVGEKKKPQTAPAHPGDSIEQAQDHANVWVNHLRSVQAGDYAGGFFGAADAANTLNVKGTDAAGSDQGFTLLHLLHVGDVAALELARSYIFNSSVTGIEEGYRVKTFNEYQWDKKEWNADKDKMASTGGFGGLVSSAGIRYCHSSKLRSVEGRNYVGGFVGRMGKSAILKIDEVSSTDNLGILGGLLNLGAGIGDVVGSVLRDSTVTGVADGYTVASDEGSRNIAGGFVGFADVCRVQRCTAQNLREVRSREIAGGFMGAMSDATLLNLNVGLLGKIFEGVQVNLDLIKANRSKVNHCTVVGVDDWNGYSVLGGGATLELPSTNTSNGYAGAFIGLNTGSTVENGRVRFANLVKSGPIPFSPYVGVQENHNLLADVQLSILAKLPEIADGWSKSHIDDLASNYEAIADYSGQYEKPSQVPGGLEVSGTDQGGEHVVTTLSTRYYYQGKRKPLEYVVNDPDHPTGEDLISGMNQHGWDQQQMQHDLMIHKAPGVTRQLAVTKQLQYEPGAVVNAVDQRQSFLLRVTDAAGTVTERTICPGQTVVIDAPAKGNCVIEELALPDSPHNVSLAKKQTVLIQQDGTVQEPAVTRITLINTVKAPLRDPITDQPYESGGKYVVNRIPMDEEKPDAPILHPCEVLHILPAVAAIALHTR